MYFPRILLYVYSYFTKGDTDVSTLDIELNYLDPENVDHRFRYHWLNLSNEDADIDSGRLRIR